MSALKPFQVFVPGLLQTSLKLEEETIWPPSPDIFLVLQQNKILRRLLAIKPKDDIKDWIEKFTDKNIKPDKFISPYPGFEEKFLVPEHVIFTYDWRQSQKKTSEELINFLTTLEVPEGFYLEVIGFSIGGNIAFMSLVEAQTRGLSFMRTSQKLLGSEGFQGSQKPQSLQGKVKRLITIGSPLKGSIKATATFLGVDNSQPDFIKKIIHDEVFESIYELIPSNPNLFFFKEDETVLTKAEFKDLFLKTPHVNAVKFENALSFKKEWNKLPRLKDVDVICYRGCDVGSQNIFKCVVRESIIPFFESSNSDGTITCDEATFFDTQPFLSRTVQAKHSTLLQSDELISMISDNHNLSEIRLELVSSSSSLNSFKILSQTLTETIPIKKITAKKISLLHKGSSQDVTSNLKKKKDEVWISIPSKYETGCLLFEDVSFSCLKDDEKVKIVKARIFASFEILNPNIFF